MPPGNRPRGQVIIMVAAFLPVFVLALVLLGEVLVTARAVQQTATALDLAVHAGAQTAQAEGRGLRLDPARAEAQARLVYLRNGAPGRLLELVCGAEECLARAAVSTPGWVLPPQTLIVEARAEPLAGIDRGGD